jgi:hypothetical protein
MITSLSIVITHTYVNSIVILDIIRRLPKLRTLVVRVYLDLAPAGGWHGFTSQRNVQHGWHGRIADGCFNEWDMVDTLKVTVARDERTVWSVSVQPKRGYQEPIFMEARIDLPEFEKEISDWMSLNSRLDRIALYFDWDMNSPY